MKIFTKMILDNNNNVVEEDYYNYFGPISYCGIHYNFKSTRGAKAMAKRLNEKKSLLTKEQKNKLKWKARTLKKKKKIRQSPLTILSLWKI